MAVNAGEEPGTAQAFIEEGRYTFPVALDFNMDVVQPYNVESFPSSFLIDRGTLERAITPLYWAPGELVNPTQVIEAGDTARVIGLDASGEYYQIIWVCDFLWVPKDTLAPNPDAVWQGAPLPTDVVE